jgi:predicted metal-binding membrane protein
MKASLALAAVVGLAWAWLIAGAGIGMEQMDMGGGGMMLMRPEWTWGYGALVFLMWVAMMAAMMLPGAAPAILGAASPVAFAGGYLGVWSGFSGAATVAQFALDRAGLISDAMALNSRLVAGLLILAVGAYQLTPWKRSFLRLCNATPDGLRYGASCLGCCWALMALLFVAGLMNLLWVAGITLWVSAEKLLPWRERFARVVGAMLIVWGGVSLALAVSR